MAKTAASFGLSIYFILGFPVSLWPQEAQTQPPAVSVSSVHNYRQSANRLFENQAKVDLALALELKDQHRLSAALRRFQDFMLLYPSHRQLPLVVGHIVDIYEQMSSPDRALKTVATYLDNAGHDAQSKDALPLLLKRIELEYSLGNWQGARSSCQQLIRGFAASAEAGEARRYLALMDTVEAKETQSTLPTQGDTVPDLVESSLDRLGEGLDIEH